MVPLADTCELFTDGNWIESKDQSSNGIRLIQTGNVGNGGFKDRREKARWISPETFARLKCQEIIPGDCLVSRLPDPVGRSCIIPDTGDKMITAVDCSILRFDASVLLSDFFNYYSQSKTYHAGVESKCTGATRKRISRKNLGIISIPIPPLPEQKRIVAILDEAFAGITQAVANAEKNLANARELFESYLNVRLLKVASEYSAQTMLDITELIVDCEHKTAPRQDSGHPSIRTPNVGKGELILDRVNRVSEETYALWTRRAIPMPSDLILAREAPAGNIGVIPEGEQVCLGQRTVLIRPKKEIINSYYLAYLILHPLTQKRLLAHSTGATVQHVNMKDIRQLPIGNLPSLREQLADVQAIGEARTYFNELETIYQQKLTVLTELKQSILQKAFAGELTADSQQVNG